ncbi:MAG: LamG-like jellyroll fold domain-containing protein [Oligoflexales bacterium]
MKLLNVRFLSLSFAFTISSCDAPFGGDAIATLKSPVISALNTSSSEGDSQLRADSLALGTTMIQELQEDLVSGGMDLVQANAITTSATKSMKAGTLAIGLHLAEDDQDVVITKAIDVASLIVKGAVGGLNSPDAALSDLELRSSFTSKILDSSIDSVTAPGRSSSDGLAALAQTMVGQAVSSLDDAGFGDDAASGAAAVTQGAMQSLGRQSSLDTSVLVSVAQSVATGAVAAIGRAGVSDDKLGDVAKSLTQGAVSALSASSNVDDAKMAQMVKSIAKGAVKGIAASSAQGDSAKAALASSVTEGAVGGLSQSSGRELSSITKAVTEGAVSGIKDVGSGDISAVAQSIAAGAMTGLSNVGGDAQSVSSLASSVAAGAIGGLKDSGISDAEAAKAAGGCVQGSIAGLSSLDLKDANGSASSNLTEAIGLVTEGAMSSLSSIAPSGDTTFAAAMASASMAGLSTLKSGFDAKEGSETVDLAGAASRVAQGAVKALEAQNDGTIDLGSQLQAVTGGMVGSMKTAGFSESDLSSGAGAIAAGAVKGFENDSSASYVSNVMAGTMGNLDNAGMSDSDIALAMSDIVGKTMEAVGERSTAKGSTASSSAMIQGIVSGAVQGLDGAEMSDSTAVQSAVQGIARGATGGLKKAGVSASDMSSIASAVTKTSIQQLSQVKVAGAQIDATNIQAMASKVARGSMEGFTTASQEFATGGESVASLNDFASEVSKGALDGLKDIKSGGTVVDFGNASADLAGAILEGAAQNDGGLGDLETQLNTAIRENVSSELSTAELDQLTTEISQKANEAESLSTALSGGAFESCHDSYGDQISDDAFYPLLPGDNSVVLCQKQAGSLCPKPRIKNDVNVNWYPLASQENLCELEFFSNSNVILGDFNFSSLSNTVTDSTLSLTWTASTNANFYSLKVASDEGCQNTVHEDENIPNTQLSMDYTIPDVVPNGTWYVCLGSRTESFQFNYSTPPSKSFTLNRTTNNENQAQTPIIDWFSESQDKGPAYYFRYTNDEGEFPGFAPFAKPITVELVSIKSGQLHALSEANQFTPENINPGDPIGDNVYWRWVPDENHTHSQEYEAFDYKITDANGDVFNLTARVGLISTDGDDTLTETNSNDDQFYGGFGGDTITGTNQSDEILADSEIRISSLHGNDSSQSDPVGWYVVDKGGPSDVDSYPNWHSMSENGVTLNRYSMVTIDRSGRGAVAFSGAGDVGFDGTLPNQLSGGFTLAILARIQASAGTLFSAGDSSDVVGLEVTGDGRVRVISTSLIPNTTQLQSSVVADGKFHMFVLKVDDAGTQTLYVDGHSVSSSSGSPLSDWSAVRIGHGYASNTGTNASVSEFLFYDEALNGLEREHVERYLAYRAGLEIRDLTFSADILTGGSGADVFSWSEMSYSLADKTDTITDFNPAEGDILDFRGFSDVSLNLENGATMQGEVGQLIAEVTGSDTFVKLDFQGDGAVDFEIKLQDYTGGLVPSNFLLPIPGHNSGVQWEDFFQASRYDRGFDGDTTSGGSPAITTWASVPHSFSEGGKGASLAGFTQSGEGWRSDALNGKTLAFKGGSFVSLPDLEKDAYDSGISFVILAQMEAGTPAQDRVLFSYHGKDTTRKIELIQKTDNDVVLDLGVTTKSLGFQFGGNPVYYSIAISSGGMLDVYVNGAIKVNSSYDASGWAVDDTMEGRLGQLVSGSKDFHGHIALFAVARSSLYQSSQSTLFNDIANIYRTHPVSNQGENSGLMVYLDAANNRRIGFKDMTGVASCAGLPVWSDLMSDLDGSISAGGGCNISNDTWLGDGSAGDPYRFKFTDSFITHTVKAMTAQKLSLEAWVKVAGGTSSCDLVKWEDGSISGRHNKLSLGGVGEIKMTGDYLPFQMGSDIDDGQWHHIVLSSHTQTGGAAKLYLDGVKVGDAIMTGGTITSGIISTLKIGKFAGGCAAEYGMMRLYNSVPSDADVLSQCEEKEADYSGASCGP